MIHYKKGDVIQALIDSEIQCMAHGVNCQGGFGSGIAGQLAERIPYARERYIEKHLLEGWSLGEVQETISKEGLIVLNCATQYTYGRSPQRYVNYDSIYIVLDKLKKYCENNDRSLGLPRIGCGLAGGNWNIVDSMLNAVFKNSFVDVTVYEYK